MQLPGRKLIGTLHSLLHRHVNISNTLVQPFDRVERGLAHGWHTLCMHFYDY